MCAYFVYIICLSTSLFIPLSLSLCLPLWFCSVNSSHAHFAYASSLTLYSFPCCRLSSGNCLAFSSLTHILIHIYTHICTHTSPHISVSLIDITVYLQTASLIIPAVVKLDSGNYTCSPSNSAPRTIVLHVLNGECGRASASALWAWLSVGNSQQQCQLFLYRMPIELSFHLA